MSTWMLNPRSSLGRRRFRPCFTALLLILLSTSVASPGRTQDTVLFEHVSLIDMKSAGSTPDSSVLIKNGRIAQIGTRKTLRAAKGIKRIDGRGKYLIPGLSDMHVHIWAESELALYIASGVTLVRNMWGESETLAMARRTADGQVIGPTIITAGRLTDGAPPLWGEVAAIARTPQQANDLMDMEQAAGFRFFKIYENITLDVFDAIAARSRQSGFPFAGHVPRAVPLDHALRSGIWSIEHLTGWIAATRVPGVLPLRAEEPDDDKRRARWTAIGKALDAGTMNDEQVFSSERRRAFAQLTAENNVAMVPTLFVNRMFYLTVKQQQAQLARPEIRYIAPDLVASWNPVVDFRRKDDQDVASEAYARILNSENAREIADLKAAGALILAGTDAPNPYVLHGFSLADELDDLVKAGLTPFEALASSTSAPARFLGFSDRGTVSVGNRADLVLLDADPLSDINAVRQVAGVMLAGKWLDRRALDDLLDRVVKGYQVPSDWFGAVAGEPETAWDRRYLRGSSGTSVGTESIGTTKGGNVVAQASLRDGASTASLIWHILPSPLGKPARISFEFRRTLGTAALAVAQDDRGIHATGIDFAGRTLHYDLPGDNSRLSCAFAVCTELLLPDLLSIGVGKFEDWHVAVVDQFQQRIYSEAWHIARITDGVNGASFKIDATRGTENYTISLTVKDDHIISQQNTMLSEVITIDRANPMTSR